MHVCAVEAKETVARDRGKRKRHHSSPEIVLVRVFIVKNKTRTYHTTILRIVTTASASGTSQQAQAAIA